MISQAERTWFICVRFDDFTSWTDMIHQSEIRWFHRLKGHGKTDMIHLSEIWWFHKLNGHAKTDTIRLSNIWLFHTLNGHGKTDMIHLSEIWWFYKLNGHGKTEKIHLSDLMISQAERTCENEHNSSDRDLMISQALFCDTTPCSFLNKLKFRTKFGQIPLEHSFLGDAVYQDDLYARSHWLNIRPG